MCSCLHNYPFMINFPVILFWLTFRFTSKREEEEREREGGEICGLPLLNCTEYMYTVLINTNSWAVLSGYVTSQYCMFMVQS